MTAAQLQTLNDANAAFLAAEAANVAAQKEAGDASAAAAAAQSNATVTVPRDNAAAQLAANNAFFAAQAAQQAAISKANSAQDAQSQAQINLQNAVLASLQTGATEDVSHTSKPLTF